MAFVQTKRQTHRLHIVLGLLGIRVRILHKGAPCCMLHNIRFGVDETDIIMCLLYLLYVIVCGK